jgi:Rieske Fe-S protein
MAEVNRREMLLAIAAVPSLCCTTAPVPPDACRFEKGVLLIDLRRAPLLQSIDGSGRVVNFDLQLNLIVVNLGHGEFLAADRSCTHGGAQVVWSRHHKALQCTSWGHSEFASDGRVLGGSAREPLRVYPAALENSTLKIEPAPRS